MEKKTSKFLRGEILSSICYIVLGLCLVLIPDQTVNIICKVVFGLVMIAAGIYQSDCCCSGSISFFYATDCD